MSNKKKVSLVLSIVSMVFAVITLIMGIVFIAIANGVVKDQMNNYSVNRSTVMWISGLGEPFFGSSTGKAIAGIALSLITIFTIIGIWLLIHFRNKKKNIKFNGTKKAIAFTSITSVAAIVGMSVSSVATHDFNQNADMNRISNYFETNAEKISKDRTKAAKAGLLYVLSNKNDLGTFSKASTLQMTMALTVFTVLKDEIQKGNQKIIKDLKEFSSNNKELFDPVKGQFKGTLIKPTKTQSAGEVWISLFPGYKSLMDADNKNKYAANILSNHDAFLDLTSGKYVEIFNRIKKAFDKRESFSYNAFVASDERTQKILVEEGLFNVAGDTMKPGVFEWFNKLGRESLKFEQHVIGTIVKLFKLPYTTKEEQFKSRITILEWLNTIINGIDYISKDEAIKLHSASSSKTIYMPTTHLDGTFEIIPSKEKEVGKVGDNAYSVKLAMMKYILTNLSKKDHGIIEILKKRQKNITPISFAGHILASKGLEKMTDQYKEENSYYNNPNSKEEIKNIVKKINSFIK